MALLTGGSKESGAPFRGARSNGSAIPGSLAGDEETGAQGKRLKMYQQSLDAYVKPAVGHVRLTRLSPSHIEAIEAELLARVYGSTAATARLPLNGALKKAQRLGLILVNPVESTDGPTRGKPNRSPLNVNEALPWWKRARVRGSDSSSSWPSTPA